MILSTLLPLTLGHKWQYDINMPVLYGGDVNTVDLRCDSGSVDHNKIVVAAVGDSITVGATCSDPGGFVRVLQAALEADPNTANMFDVRDCGQCGHDCVRKNHGNVKHATYWYTGAMNESLAMKPDMVIFMLGTNDADEWYNTSKYYQQDFLDLVDEYVMLPSKPKIYTMIPPPYGNTTCIGNPNPTCLKPFDKECTINCVLPKLVPLLTAQINAKKPQLDPPIPELEVIDLLTFLGGPDHTNKSAQPGLHPNCDGYELIGNYLKHRIPFV